MIDDSLQYDFAGTPITASPRWQTGTGTGLAFATVGGATVLSMTSGTDIALRTESPTRIHQGLEIWVQYDTASAPNTYSGVVARFIDPNNYVLLKMRHDGDHAVSLVERISGIDYIRGSFVVGANAGASIRLEVIQQRCRVWIDSTSQGVYDRRPDIGYDLQGNYPETKPGKWGIYASSGASNTAYILHFKAQELPSTAPPKPYLVVANAPALRLVPATVTFTGFNLGDGYIETEVSPADPTDFPELYTDRIIATQTSHVVFVRPGYLYNIRARQIATGEIAGPWTQTVQFSTGSKATPATGTLLPSTFPSVVPDYVIAQTSTAIVKQTVANTGHPRVESLQRGTRRSYKLIFNTRTRDEYQQLLSFFDQVHGKLTAFNWQIPDTGEYIQVRFDSDDYEAVYSAQSQDNGLTSPIVSLSFNITEIDQTANTNLSIVLTLSSAFY